MAFEASTFEIRMTNMVLGYNNAALAASVATISTSNVEMPIHM